MASRDFPKLAQAQQRASKAIDVLTSAIESLQPRDDGESLADLATRLRGASVLAHSAGLELATVAGWNEAAGAANDAGLLSEENER